MCVTMPYGRGRCFKGWDFHLHIPMLSKFAFEMRPIQF